MTYIRFEITGQMARYLHHKGYGIVERRNQVTGKRKDSKGRILRTGESQRSDGRYCYKYIDAKGKQQFVYAWKLEPTDRLPKGKRDGPALREKEKEIQKDQLDGIDHSGANMTVLDLYVKHIGLNPQVKPSTVRGRERRKKMLENDPLGSMKISSVKLSDAKGWALRQQAKGTAYHTIRTDKRALKAAFYTAISDDCIRKNPFDFRLTDVILNDTEAKIPLSAEQEKSLLDFLQTDKIYRKYYDEVVILLGTGLRISEFCGLTRQDIDLETSIINVDHQLQKDATIGKYIGDPKSKSGIRQIRMGPEVREAFQRVLSRPQTGKNLAIDGYRNFLFCSKSGNPRTAVNYENIIRHIRVKHAKLHGSVLPENMTPHSLRHTFCTKMANAGMNPKALQYVMGHADIKLTMGYYAHTDPVAAMEAMRQVQEPEFTTQITTFEGQIIPRIA